MIQTTTWSPDTCGCTVQYQWDDSLPQNLRVHTISNVITKCNSHASLSDMATHFNTLQDENPRKNKLLAYITSNFSSLTTIDSKGTITLKDGILTWFYDANRVLNISISSLTPSQKMTLQTYANSTFGVGKVLLS